MRASIGGENATACVSPFDGLGTVGQSDLYQGESRFFDNAVVCERDGGEGRYGERSNN